jgi:hypothetical protein
MTEFTAGKSNRVLLQEIVNWILLAPPSSSLLCFLRRPHARGEQWRNRRLTGGGGRRRTDPCGIQIAVLKRRLCSRCGGYIEPQRIRSEPERPRAYAGAFVLATGSGLPVLRASASDVRTLGLLLRFARQECLMWLMQRRVAGKSTRVLGLDSSQCAPFLARHQGRYLEFHILYSRSLPFRLVCSIPLPAVLPRLRPTRRRAFSAATRSSPLGIDPGNQPDPGSCPA